MNSVKHQIKVLLVDDHPVVRKGLCSCLASQPNLNIVGEASNGKEAIQKVRELSPDVVLMDIEMPELAGLAATEFLHNKSPQVKVLILSMHSDPDQVRRVIKAGAHGYVLKDSPPDELVRAIEAVHAGESFFSPAVARIALNQMVSDADIIDPFSRLSEREREVLTLIADGESNRHIAVTLGIGVRTIETHRKRIMHKLGVHSVARLTKLALAHGLVSLDEKKL